MPVCSEILICRLDTLTDYFLSKQKRHKSIRANQVFAGTLSCGCRTILQEWLNRHLEMRALATAVPVPRCQINPVFYIGRMVALDKET